MNNSITKAMAAITSADAAPDDAPYGGFEAILSTPALDRDGDQLRTSEWKTPLPEHITVDIDHEMSVRGTVGSATPYLDDDGNLRIRAQFASTATAQEVRTLVKEGHVRTVSVAFMTDKSALKDGRPSREVLNAGIVAVPSNREALILSAKSATEPYGPDADYADPGFQPDKRKRYPLRDAEEVRTAWDYVHQQRNRRPYTAEQLTHIESKIRAAAHRYGVELDDSKALAGMVDVKAGARNSASDQALIQSIHDASGQLGAACVPGDDTGYEDGANMRAVAAAETKSADTPAVLDFQTFLARLSALLTEATTASPNSAGTPQDSHGESATSPADPPADAAPQGPADAAGDAAVAAEESGDAVAAAQAELHARLALASLAEDALSDEIH
ncbi:DUF6582 domain-containing protein [Nocardia terpenica]|nr:DUF6582 domain-containing protein [Nocardia terpenica]NQE89777.1 hypothetical protein [Nocardia terpenica]